MRGRVAAGHLAIVWMVLFLHEATAQKCSKNPECMCYFGENKDPVIEFLQGTGSDTKSLGLSAATGALSSLVLVGGGVALWKHFKSRSSVDDVYGRPPSSRGSWMEDRKTSPRRGSFPFSDDGYDPTGKMQGMSKSNPTNIYKHGGKVWPGIR